MEDDDYGFRGLRADAEQNEQQQRETGDAKRQGAKGFHGLGAAGAGGVAGVSACWRPRASELPGSVCRAWLTSSRAAGSWCSVRSRRASVSQAAALGRSLSEACASARACALSPLRRRTSARPAWASASFILAA